MIILFLKTKKASPPTSQPSKFYFQLIVNARKKQQVRFLDFFSELIKNACKIRQTTVL